MDYYRDIYHKRLNRHGLDFQSRIQGMREYNFDNYLLKSIYRVDFWYNNIYEPASLEHYKQDDSQTISYLLTRRELEIPNGTVLEVESLNGDKTMWMIWWLERLEASGYNRYIVLKMTQELVWEVDGEIYRQHGYFEGPGASKIKDTIRSASAEAIYAENNNLYLFITPYNSKLNRDQYLEVTHEETTLAFTVTETDVISTPGVAYVSVDPSYIRNKDKIPEAAPGEEEKFFWLNGGK